MSVGAYLEAVKAAWEAEFVTGHAHPIPAWFEGSTGLRNLPAWLDNTQHYVTASISCQDVRMMLTNETTRLAPTFRLRFNWNGDVDRETEYNLDGQPRFGESSQQGIWHAAIDLMGLGIGFLQDGFFAGSLWKADVVGQNIRYDANNGAVLATVDWTDQLPIAPANILGETLGKPTDRFPSSSAQATGYEIGLRIGVTDIPGLAVAG